MHISVVHPPHTLRTARQRTHADNSIGASLDHYYFCQFHFCYISPFWIECHIVLIALLDFLLR